MLIGFSLFLFLLSYWEPKMAQIRSTWCCSLVLAWEKSLQHQDTVAILSNYISFSVAIIYLLSLSFNLSGMCSARKYCRTPLKSGCAIEPFLNFYDFHFLLLIGIERDYGLFFYCSNTLGCLFNFLVFFFFYYKNLFCQNINFEWHIY